MRWLLSPQATADLDTIWDYTAENWGVKQAEIYAHNIKTAIEGIADNPKLGRTCDDIREGYAKYPAGSHMIFYKIFPKKIEIIRILHQNMDYVRRLY